MGVWLNALTHVTFLMLLWLHVFSLSFYQWPSLLYASSESWNRIILVFCPVWPQSPQYSFLIIAVLQSSLLKPAAAQTFGKERSLGESCTDGHWVAIGAWNHTNAKEERNRELEIQMKVFLFTTVYILNHLLRTVLCKFNPVFLFLL